MANAVAVDHWSAEGIRLSSLIGALGELRDSSGLGSSARTAVMTLVAVAPTDEDAYGATGVLRGLAGHHPARIVLLRPDPDSVAALNARATLYAIESDHHRVNFEEVVLEVGGQAANHLDSLVEAFTLSDLPVAVWYVNSIPQTSDPLLSVATAALVDSRDAPDPVQLRSLLQLARRRTLVDLSWLRLAPVRELLAALFDPPATRAALESVQSVHVAGKPGPRRLLGGWIAAQTGVHPRHVTLSDARHVSIQLVCGMGSGTASFSVERAEGQRLLVAEAAGPARRAVHLTATVPDDSLASSLSQALTNLAPDAVWERALSSATAPTD